MNRTPGSTLTRAYEAIEAGDPQLARDLLEPVLNADPRNTDAWWIYAHAVDDPELARRALTNVLDLDPQYPGAADLMSVLEAQYPARTPEPIAPPPVSIRPLTPRPAAAVPGTVTPEIGTPERTPASVPPPAPYAPEQPERRRGFPWWILLAAALAIVVIGVIVVNSSTPADPLPEQVALGGTALPEAGTNVVPELTIVNATPSGATPPGTPEAAAQSAATDQVTPEATDDETGAAFDTATDEPAEATREAVSQSAAAETAVADDGTAAPDDATAAETPEATEQAAAPAPDETETPQDTATLAPPTQEVIGTTTTGFPQMTPELLMPTDEEGQGGGEFDQFADGTFLAAVTRELEAVSLRVAPEALVVQTTPLGSARVVGVCTTPNRLRADVETAMNAAAAQSEALGETAEVVGVQMVHCEGGGVPLRLIVVSKANAQAFARGELSARDFQAQWRSL
jgi:hypothetical protein